MINIQLLIIHQSQCNYTRWAAICPQGISIQWTVRCRFVLEIVSYNNSTNTFVLVPYLNCFKLHLCQKWIINIECCFFLLHFYSCQIALNQTFRNQVYSKKVPSVIFISSQLQYQLWKTTNKISNKKQLVSNWNSSYKR